MVVRTKIYDNLTRCIPKWAASWITLKLVLFLSACISASQPSITNHQTVTENTYHTETPDVIPSDTLALTASPIASPENPLTQTKYVLDARLDYPKKHLSVRQLTSYFNTFEEGLDELVFLVEPNWREDVFILNQAHWGNGDQIEYWTLQGGIMKVPLPSPLSPGEYIEIILEYEIDIPANPGTLGYTYRQTNLGNWYPFVPPYSPDLGWLAYQPGPVGEHIAYDTADFEVNLTLASETPLILAASTSYQRIGNTYHFQSTESRNFTLSISPSYQVLSQKIGEVEVLSYFFPETKAGGEGVLRTTAEAIKIYNQYFGPYPHSTLSVVQASFPDGMEFDGLYFLSEEFYWGYRGDNMNLLTTLSAHETSHQWWYGLLGSNQAIEPWLDEALATYSEVIYYEQMYPDLVDWWWNFRVQFYDPDEGKVNDSIYKYGSFRPYVNAIYLRGALFLSELRELIGDEAFFSALEAYAMRNRHSFVTQNDFWSIILEFSDVDLIPLQNKYFSGPNR
jgi:hypothetical protein